MDLSILVQVGTAMVAALALLVALTQTRVMRTTTDGSLIHEALALLNSAELRSARRTVYGLTDKDVSVWSEEEKAAVEIVGGQFSHLGFMVKNGYVPLEAFIEAWEYRFTRTFKIIARYLSSERDKLELPEHWIYFEWLARTACAMRLTKDPWWVSDRRWAQLKTKTAHKLPIIENLAPEPSTSGHQPSAGEAPT